MHRLEVDLEQLDAAGSSVPLIDVRNPDEYEAERVPGARLLPLGELVAREGEIPREGPVYLICATGARSLKAAEYLRWRGVEAWSVAGGTKAWAESGRPTEAGTAV